MSTSLLPAGAVTTLRDLVAYAEGAVVSRVIMKQNGGQLTLFAFDAGQELSEHTTPYDALVQVLDGTAEIIIAGASHHVAAGSSIMMPGGVAHAVKAPTAFTMLLTMVK